MKIYSIPRYEFTLQCSDSITNTITNKESGTQKL